MAASTSREPQSTSLPPGPPLTSEKHGKSGQRLKGKGKSMETSGGQKRRSASGKSVPATPSGYENDPLLNWVSLTDSSPSKTPPIFTKDGSYYFALGGSSVKIFATATGQLVSTLSSPPSSTGTSSEVLTSVLLNPQNIFQIITSSLDGFIRIWDYLDATLIRTLDIGQPIHHMSTHAKHRDFIFVTASRSNKLKKKPGEDGSFVLRISLKPSDASAQSSIQKSSDVTPIGKTRAPTGLAVSPSGNWLVATAGHKAYVANVLDIRSGFTKYVSPERLTCLTFHPVEDYFATGDVKGNIRLWYCLDESATVKVPGLEKKTQTTSFHWHAHAVASLAFTSNGAYLLSGGEESVLVIWQLHSGKKEFVPRIGAPLQTISITAGSERGEEYLLGLTDATFVFVSAATLKISRSYSRIKLVPLDNVSSFSKAVPLALHHSSSTFILPSSHASSIQMFSLTSSKIVSELEIAPSNRVSRRDEKPIEPSRVERTVISPSGEWMATTDARPHTEDFHGEVYLKIWRWDRKTSLWTLNTRIDRPHGPHSVLDLSFNPRPHASLESFLVTAGSDGTVKTWRVCSNRERGEEFWAARSSLSFRNEVPCHVSWSPDGSLIAVALGRHVSLYDAMTNIHRVTLTSPECLCATKAHFVGRGRFLAIQGQQELVIWDIVSHAVRWSFSSPFPIHSVVPHPDNDSFAVIIHLASDRSRVHIFSVSHPKPSRTAYLPFSLQSIVWYSPHPTDNFGLAGITQDWRFVLVGDDMRPPEEEGTSAKGIKSRAPLKPRTLFQDIFGKSAFDQSLTDSSSAATLRQAAESISQSILDVPSHLAAPVETLFNPLMMRLLKRHPNGSNDISSTEVAEDEDVEMELDNIEVSSPSPRLKVDSMEISLLAAVFQASSLQAHGVPKGPKVNGVVKVNGVNSRPSPSKASKLANQVEAIPSPSVDPAPSPMVNGNSKKRKKASDYF
ncbi:hypothetical protein GYMLUDRAFT_32726 [Collybiopsis luxurians FD-317 M1]|nr:hypothetical protein GYMLUDRAFT_32726 [Collybiopsis luxurians FD-317 M1]